MRGPIVCGNWKMYKTRAEAEAFARAFAAAYGQPRVATGRAVLFPSFPFLQAVKDALGECPIDTGAQCCHAEPEGAYTGAVACEMVASVGARWVLCGHSERRQVFGEEDGDINMQLRAALATGLRPVLCVGESLSERERDRTRATITQQLVLGLDGLNVRELEGLTVAYEPVWAIGTGRTATPAQAQEIHRFIRETLAQRFQDAVADTTPILYGGSVKPGNAAELMAEPDIDGLLVGGASLEVESFTAIARAAGL